MTTTAPCSAKARAVAAPMPRDPPVTSATRRSSTCAAVMASSYGGCTAGPVGPGHAVALDPRAGQAQIEGVCVLWWAFLAASRRAAFAVEGAFGFFPCFLGAPRVFSLAMVAASVTGFAGVSSCEPQRYTTRGWWASTCQPGRGGSVAATADRIARTTASGGASLVR